MELVGTQKDNGGLRGSVHPTQGPSVPRIQGAGLGVPAAPHCRLASASTFTLLRRPSTSAGWGAGAGQRSSRPSSNSEGGRRSGGSRGCRGWGGCLERQVHQRPPQPGAPSPLRLCVAVSVSPPPLCWNFWFCQELWGRLGSDLSPSPCQAAAPSNPGPLPGPSHPASPPPPSSWKPNQGAHRKPAAPPPGGAPLPVPAPIPTHTRFKNTEPGLVALSAASLCPAAARSSAHPSRPGHAQHPGRLHSQGCPNLNLKPATPSHTPKLAGCVVASERCPHPVL